MKQHSSMKLTIEMLSELDAEDVCVCGHVRRQHLSEQPRRNHNGCFSRGCDCISFVESGLTEQPKRPKFERTFGE